MTTLRGWAYAPAIAFQFLTRIPINFVPDDAFDEWGGRRAALVFFPLVGIVVGAIGGSIFDAISWIGLPAAAAAIGAVAATASTTGCFHEDGFADTADGLGPHSREAAFRAMRDSRIGSFGSMALWALLSLKVVALTSIASHSVLLVMVAAHAAARWSPLPLARFLPYVQETSGLGGGIAQLVGRREILLSTLLMLAIVMAVFQFSTLTALGVAISLTVLCGLFFRRRFGGVTGDCLGAANQVVETGLLLLASRLMPHDLHL